MRKRIGLKVVKVVAIIAAVVFLLVPLATWTQVLLFIVSIVVLLIFSAATKNLDDTSDDKDASYWPNKPNKFL
jgi:membrane protein implicated in regulation of membrane protease activity